MESILWASAAALMPLVIFGLLIWRLWPSSVGGFLGLYPAVDDITDTVRRFIIADVEALEVRKLPREEAEQLVVDVTKHAIARAFAKVFAPNSFSSEMFKARCIITENIAVIAPSLGPDYTADRNGFRPLTVEVKRDAMILDARPKIRRAIQGSEIPNGQPDAKQNARK